MCIIAIKPKNVAMPTSDILLRMFNRNPDGAGIAYTTGRSIKIVKGIMNIADFLKACSKIPVKATAIIHTRISTSGGIKKELCHPYELTNDFKKLRRLRSELTEGYAVAHNGIFSEFGNVANANDTMQFIATYLQSLKELKEKAGGSVLDDDIDSIINRLVSGSRMVIMSVDGKFKKYGNGWEESNGIYYSNGGYKDYQYYKVLNDDYYVDGYGNIYGTNYYANGDYYNENDDEYWDWWEKQHSKVKVIKEENGDE